MPKFLFLDCETAETPKINGQLDVANGQVYDLGIAVVDETGQIYDQMSMVNEDVFFGMSQSMQEAYYADKIPQYLEDMRMGNHKIVDTWQMYQIFHQWCNKWEPCAVVAHNAFFDVKALNATMRYQTKSRCRWFLPWGMVILDTMAMARNTFVTDPQYVTWCKEHGYMTNHCNPRPRLTAEVLYKFITKNLQFEESHTGLEDVKIETQIFVNCLSRMGGNPPILYIFLAGPNFNNFVIILCLICNTFYDIITVSKGGKSNEKLRRAG